MESTRCISCKSTIGPEKSQRCMTCDGSICPVCYSRYEGRCYDCDEYNVMNGMDA